MACSNKRKNVAPASSKTLRPTKRQRKPTRPFEQGVNPPAPPTPPSTVRRPQHSQNPSQQRDRNTPSPLFEPETTTASQVASIPAEDEDDEEEFANDAADDDDEPVQNMLDAVRAVEEPAAARTIGSPSVAAAATVAESSQQQRPESRVEEINEEPHLHFWYRAWWGAIEKNGIASASNSRRNKALYTVNEDKVWRWADGVVELQKPRVANIESLMATLYYTSGNRQARADRCTIALQRSCSVASEGLVIGNWFDFEDEVTEMDKESSQVLSCDFDLVLKEELLAQQPALQSASQPSRGAIRARPGIVTAIQEDGLASVVTNERCASGSAIGIRDREQAALMALCSTLSINLLLES